jgi:hypothetical protein
MAKRNCFYSFHFARDNWRAGTVRSIGVIDGNEPASDNDWEAVTSGSADDKDRKIRTWIAGQMRGKSCTIVLVGTQTADRKWINHEIVKSWDDGLGVVGICIHGLKNNEGAISNAGANPFDFITHGPTKKKLSEIVKCYDPPGANSKERYDWIAKYLSAAVEEAIEIRGNNK